MWSEHVTSIFTLVFLNKKAPEFTSPSILNIDSFTYQLALLGANQNPASFEFYLNSALLPNPVVIPFPPLFAKTRVIYHPWLPRTEGFTGTRDNHHCDRKVTGKLEQVGHPRWDPLVLMVCGPPCCSKLINPLMSNYGCDLGGLYHVGFIKAINFGRVHRGQVWDQS